jgi:DNA-binding LacI/PurR family transcriptional regulator
MFRCPLSVSVQRGGEIFVDYLSLLKAAVGTLVEQGCQRIAFINNHSESDDRKAHSFDQNFKAFLKARGAAFYPELLRYLPLGDAPEESGYTAVKELFAEGGSANPCDGIIFIDDVMAKGGCDALVELGVSIGDEVKVATHLNKGSTILLRYEREITRLEIDCEEMVGAAFELMEKLISGEIDTPYRVGVQPTVCS